MTELKELSGVDDAVLSRMKDMGIEDADSLKKMLEENGPASLAEQLEVDEATVQSWIQDLSESEKQEGKEEAEAEEKKEEVSEEKPAAAGEEEELHKAKRKPVLTAEMEAALELRREIAERRPKFLRAEYFKAQRLGMKWRKPRGKQSKMRLFVYYRPKSVSVGYRSPSSVRGLHPSGFSEKLVFNVEGLEGVDPKTTAVRIGHSVGSRKRQDIVAEAEKLEIRVLNG